MSHTPYALALRTLGREDGDRVEAALETWSADHDLAQVRANLAAETALGSPDFVSLLGSFAGPLKEGHPTETCWKRSCWGHQRRGRRVPVENCPTVLARARGLEDYASAVAKASDGDLTKAEAKRLLLKYTTDHVPEIEPFLRDTPLGNYLLWATFSVGHPETDPFEYLPKTHQAIRTALGLGNCLASDPLVLLVWDHAESGAPPLHRPTVADAETYAFYRPRPDPAAIWGLTEPLQPNDDGLPPQPEVVLQEVTGAGLRLPIRVLQG